jgi:hypothetical protein
MTPASFNDPKTPILDAAFSVDDEVAKSRPKTRELFGETHKLNVHPSLSLVCHYSKINIVI